MKRRRSGNEIVKLILETAMTGATKTKIRFKANLSDKHAEEYLILLKVQNLLSEQRSRFYKITQKGIRFLHKTGELNELVSPVNQLIGCRLQDLPGPH